MRWFGLICLLLLTIRSARADEATAKRFRDLLANDWEYTLREDPTFASHLGDKRYNDRWPDVSLDAIARRQEHRKGLLATLEKIDPSQLPAADRLNYQLFRKETAESVEMIPFRSHLI